MFTQIIERMHNEGAFTTPATLTYRSLQLTRTETQLATWLGEYLRPHPQHREAGLLLNLISYRKPRSPDTKFGSAANLLMVENRKTYDLLTALLPQSKLYPWTRIIHGSGYSAIQLLKRLAQKKNRKPIRTIHYLGDLDTTGLKIALKLQQLSHTMRLPHLQPATQLHDLMLRGAEALGAPTGFPLESPNPLPNGKPIRHLVRFLDQQHQEQVAAILSLGHRVPEEALELALVQALALHQ